MDTHPARGPAGLSISAVASPTSGAIFGRVIDQDTHQPLDGVTVVASGPQGDQAISYRCQGTVRVCAAWSSATTWFVFSAGAVAIEHSANGFDGPDREGSTPACRRRPRRCRTIAVTQRAPAIGTSARPAWCHVKTVISPAKCTQWPHVSDLLEKAHGATSDATGPVSVAELGWKTHYYLDGLTINVSEKRGARNQPVRPLFLTRSKSSCGLRRLNTVVPWVAGQHGHQVRQQRGACQRLSYLSQGCVFGRPSNASQSRRFLADRCDRARLQHHPRRRGGWPHHPRTSFLLGGLCPENYPNPTWSNTLTDSSSTSIQAPVSLTGPRPTNPMATPTTVPLYRNATRPRPQPTLRRQNSPGTDAPSRHQPQPVRDLSQKHTCRGPIWTTWRHVQMRRRARMT